MEHFHHISAFMSSKNSRKRSINNNNKKLELPLDPISDSFQALSFHSYTFGLAYELCCTHTQKPHIRGSQATEPRSR